MRASCLKLAGVSVGVITAPGAPDCTRQTGCRDLAIQVSPGDIDPENGMPTQPGTFRTRGQYRLPLRESNRQKALRVSSRGLAGSLLDGRIGSCTIRTAALNDPGRIGSLRNGASPTLQEAAQIAGLGTVCPEPTAASSASSACQPPVVVVLVAVKVREGRPWSKVTSWRLTAASGLPYVRPGERWLICRPPRGSGQADPFRAGVGAYREKLLQGLPGGRSEPVGWTPGTS